MTSKTTTKKRRARKSYEDRTGLSSRAAKILIAATFTKPETTEDADGNVMRVWKQSELQTFKNVDIAAALANRVAVEHNEMLGTIPPTAIKYAVTKGWLLPNVSRSLYRVTLKGAIDLNLPMHFRGLNGGRKIPFVLAKG
jgi:hypothetical protein